MKNSGMSVYPDLLHSQFHATSLNDPYIYADRILGNYKEIKLDLSNDKVVINNESGLKINSINLYTTDENLPSTSTRWLEEELTLNKDNSCSFTLDSDTSYYYVSILDEKGVITSSKVLKL